MTSTDLDEEKLKAWLSQHGQEREIPVALKDGRLKALWSFTGFTTEKKEAPVERLQGSERDVALFPRSAESGQLQAAESSIKSLLGRQSQVQREADMLALKVGMQTAYAARLQKLIWLLRWQLQRIESQTAVAGELFQNANRGGKWSDTAMIEGAKIRASLEAQVKNVLRSKTVGSVAKLRWLATGSPSPSNVSRLGHVAAEGKSALTICIEESDAELKRLEALSIGTTTHQEEAGSALELDLAKPDHKELLHKCRQEHVKLFFDTQQAAEAQTEASKKIATLYTTLDRLCDGSEAGEQRKALLKVLAEVAGNQAAIHCLVKQLEQCKGRQRHLEEIMVDVRQLREAVVNSRLHNMMADEMIKELTTGCWAFLEGWGANADQAKAIMQETLQQKADLASQQQSAAGLIGIETALTYKMPLPDKEKPEKSLADYKSVSAQRQATKQTIQQYSTLLKAGQLLEEAEAMASITPVDKLAIDYGAYKAIMKQEVKALEDSKGTVEEANEDALGALPQVLQTWWEQPAVECTPWIKVEGKNAKEMLKHLRNLHAAAPPSSAVSSRHA